jgi:hypothetical protein
MFMMNSFDNEVKSSDMDISSQTVKLRRNRRDRSNSSGNSKSYKPMNKRPTNQTEEEEVDEVTVEVAVKEESRDVSHRESHRESHRSPQEPVAMEGQETFKPTIEIAQPFMEQHTHYEGMRSNSTNSKVVFSQPQADALQKPRFMNNLMSEPVSTTNAYDSMTPS